MKIAFIIIICFFNACIVLRAQTEKYIEAGNEFYKKQQYGKAETEYRRIREDDSLYAIAQFNLANTLYKSGKKDDATKIFNTLLKDKERSVQTSKLYYNKAVILTNEQRLDESIEEYKNALRKNPDDKEARENLQKALLELKKKTPPPKQEDKKKKQPQNPKMNRKEAEQRLKQLEQKEKKVQQKMQSDKTSSGSQRKDW